jgi:hypothetical protein
MIRKELHFTSTSCPLTLESKCYELCDIVILSGGKIEGYKLNIVSYILPVKSDIPILFETLPNIAYLNAEKTSAKFLVKLNFTDKSNIQLIITPPIGTTTYELKIGYYDL